MGSGIDIKSKLPNLGTSIFSVMAKLAAENKAINLSQGFPDFPCSKELVDLVSLYMAKGFNQYAPMQGVLKLREMIAKKNHEVYGVTSDPETEITISVGATEALFATITAVVNPGDEVVVFEPAFDSYVAAIELNGGICRFVPLDYPSYSYDWEKVRELVNKKTKLIIINSPHNPTGAVITEKDIKELEKIVLNSNSLLLSDEVYEHIIFKGKHESLLKHEALRQRTFVLSSFGKTFHTTGWRIGYCIAPPTLTAEFRKVHQFSTFSATTPMQYAIADFLSNKENYIKLPEFYKQKRDYFQSLIKSSRFKIMPCDGTFFQLLNFEEITNESDYDLAIRLVNQLKVASIPISVFYNDKTDHKVLRFCFAKENSTLEAAAEKLCKI